MEQTRDNMDNTQINFLDEIANFIFTSKYARYNELLGRRETWDECIDRVMEMHIFKFRKTLSKEDMAELKWAFQQVKDKKVVPSMRSMQFGGKAVFAHNARMFNCAVRHVDSPRAFAELFYLLLCGCGVGIGLNSDFLGRLPALVTAEDKTGSVITYVIEDTIEGWADSVEALLNCYFRSTAYTGRKIVFDYSKLRKKGAPLKTGGGKAPGYKGLKNAHTKIKELLDHVIEDLGQKRLKSINVYDILMHCADAVLSGGVRRSATAVIFWKDDEDMMNAKTNFTVSKHTKFYHDDDTKKWCGKVTINKKQYEVCLSDWEYNDEKNPDNLLTGKKISWLHIEPQRARSNNSVLLIRSETTQEEFTNIISKTRQWGEPGFVFGNHKWQLFNPCFEIGFIPVTLDGVCGVQFCNLTSINGAKIKSLEDFKNAAKAATIIGTLQATYSDFKYLSHAAKKLTEEEALLGVSITGIMDNHEVLLNSDYQLVASNYVKQLNESWAAKLGIKPAARNTCIKPEGTSSLALGSASGIHAHHARRYFRRVQCNKLDNVYKYFKKFNPHVCEESVWSANKTDDVVTFPIEVGPTVKVKADLTALSHLELIKSTQLNWVNPGTGNTNNKPITHNVSCTVIVKDDEWTQVIEYLFNNRDHFAAVSLLPFIGDKMYKQAPNESIVTPEDEAKWNDIVTNFKHIDYKKLEEDDDLTQVQDTMACGGGRCEL
jgi:ribonucleoside-triphosphate reductase (thioredoxin)